jgi:1-acyl-sn-glycerol-3-phosphate acyltransferase
VRNIKRWRLYPLVMTILPIKFLSCVLMIVIWCVLAYIPTIGADVRKPLSSWRYYWQLSILQVSTTLMIFVSGVSYKFKYLEADYSEYLGEDWRQELVEREKPVSTIIMNHLSWIDNFFTVKYFNSCHVARKEVSHVPILGAVAYSFGSIYATRDSSVEKRDQTVTDIGEH